MNDENSNEINIDRSPTIGARLRLAREAKKLTINDIATELRLTKHIIEHIENERWVELYARAYARGYFSNYVKYLGLPEDELLAAFNLEYTIAEPALLMSDRQDGGGNKKAVWLPVFLIIVVTTLTWFAYEEWNKAQGATEVIEGNTSLSSDAKDDSASLNEINDEQSEVAHQQEENNLEQSVNNAVELQSNSDQVLSSVPEDEVLSSDALVENNEVAILDVTLELLFNDESWVEVKDAGTNVLLNNIMNKNDSIILSGRPPLNVMLGRASAVQVKFNDEIFDVAPYTKDDVARFTLGEES